MAPAAPTPPDPVEMARSEAREAGFAEGVAAGQAEGEAQFVETIGRVKAGLAELDRVRAVLAEAYRREVVEVALAAAEALVQREISQGEATLQGLIDDAFTVLGRTTPMTLRVSTAVHERIAPWLQEQALPSLTVEADPSLVDGDLCVEAAAGSVETSMRSRIAAVRQLVLGERPGESDA